MSVSEAKRAQNRAWDRAHPEVRAVIDRRKSLKQFGLTVEGYDKMLQDQGGLCAICGGVNANGRRLAVDHCHQTDAVRSLLCNNCNVAIGLLGDDPNLAQAAADYLHHFAQTGSNEGATSA